ncbi:Predicted dehydrogenase [Salinimicrobium catena]|uniref:Predicted dehydrogenase n=1 Tax=Salinimicrobium catena TaxID=390640 RepID=A0A1H5NEZ4_9FLAO|nr:Gfo/Idh/MocA family oxidoreductase [Salinimicrobium catena]SDL44463.1 Predicted dehydrogenase [Salinimicrobium catena]SEF00040.1 Predicted dehydrogenase [Salinimicrobium catena]
MKKIKTALAGFGSGGKVYNAPIISSVPGFSINKILTSSPENIKAAKEDFPNAAIVSDYSEIIEDPEIELVIILLPNHLHCEHAQKALLKGKHVVVEKPFTSTVKEAEELIQLARQNNLLLSVNHNRRYDSDIQTIKKLIEEKRLGDVVEYEAHFDRFRDKVKDSWKENPELPGSGILYDLGSHLIDQALMLFGNPSEVFADIRTQREGAKVPDKFEILLFYPDLKVSLNAGMLVKEKGPTYSIFGTRGTFLKYGADVQEEALKNGERPQDDPKWGEEPEAIWGKLSTMDREEKIKSEPGDYRKIYENIYKAITGKEELQVTAEQARDVIKVIELACQSHSARRALEFNVS